MSALPHPLALGTLQSLGFVAAPRDRACLAVELVTSTECARPADHQPFPHAGMWQGDHPDSWTVTVWPNLD